MLIIPLHRKITLRHFPAVTFALLLTNLFVFAFLQDDDEATNEAAAYYVDSGLAAIEFPAYREYLASQGTREDAQWVLELAQDDSRWKMVAVETDAEFLKLLEADRIITPDQPEYEAWKSSRAAFVEIRDGAFSQRFLMRYTDPKAYQWLTHMFLHGSFGHLLGNMIFLVLLGILVEPALRPGAYLVAYLLCGLAAAGTSLLVHSGDPHGMLGASGAIAGLMGMYTVLFGRRRVKFFYWAFVYFDYVRGPALALLPVWLGWEVLQFLVSDTRVAYEAHAGGIVAGALIALALVRFDRTDDDYLDQEEVEAARVGRLEQAGEHLRGLEIEPAKRLLRELLHDHPEQVEAQLMYFRACRYRPDADEFHAAAKRLLDQPDHDPASDALVCESYGEYRSATGGKMKLPPDLLATLALRLARHDQPDDAVKLLTVLYRRAPRTPGLETAREALITAYRRTGRDDAAARAEALQASPRTA